MLTEGTGNFLNILAQHLPNTIRTFPGRGEILELGGREGGQETSHYSSSEPPKCKNYIKGDDELNTVGLVVICNHPEPFSR